MKKTNLKALKNWKPKYKAGMLPGIYYSWYPGLPNLDRARADRSAFAARWRKLVLALADEGEVTESSAVAFYLGSSRKEIKLKVYYVNGKPRLVVRNAAKSVTYIENDKDWEAFKDSFYSFFGD